jgi:hypothetical protein
MEIRERRPSLRRQAGEVLAQHLGVLRVAIGAVHASGCGASCAPPVSSG